MSASKLTLVLLTAVAAVVMHHYYGLMPDPMASHFDGSGRPNGYQSRDGFFLLSAVLLVGNLVIFGGIGLLFRGIPPAWINLPNRDHFLSETRREATIAFMTRQMDWYGVATVALLGVVLALACAANLDADPRLGPTPMLWLIGGYLVYSAIWLIRFVRHFHLPNAEPSSPTPAP